MKLEHITESKKNKESKLEVVKLPFKMKDPPPGEPGGKEGVV